MDINQLNNQIMLAQTLIGLGLTTYGKLKEVWSNKDDSMDEAKLDAILNEAQLRLVKNGVITPTI